MSVPLTYLLDLAIVDGNGPLLYAEISSEPVPAYPPVPFNQCGCKQHVGIL